MTTENLITAIEGLLKTYSEQNNVTVDDIGLNSMVIRKDDEVVSVNYSISVTIKLNK